MRSWSKIRSAGSRPFQTVRPRCRPPSTQRVGIEPLLHDLQQGVLGIHLGQQGHRQAAAKLLGWGRNTLTRKLKELGMDDIPE